MMRRYGGTNALIYLVCATALAGCSADESAMLCVEQTAAAESIAVSNRCNETIVVAADDGEKLIIAAGLTHQLLGAGKHMGACFAPKEPRISKNNFKCE